MRKTALLLPALIYFALAFAWAQSAAPPSHKILSDPNLFADAHIHGLDQQVHLSDEQKAKMRPVFIAEGQKLIAIMNDGSLSSEQRQSQIEQLHMQTRDKVASMLTPSQLKQFNQSPRAPVPSNKGGQPGKQQI